MRLGIGSKDVARPSPRIEVDPAGAEGGWLDLCAAKELQRASRLLRVGDLELVLLVTKRVAIAVENACPHLGRSLTDSRIHGSRIRCSAHDLEWDVLTGAILPAGRLRCRNPLRRYVVSLDQGRVRLAWPPVLIGDGPSRDRASSRSTR